MKRRCSQPPCRCTDTVYHAVHHPHSPLQRLAQPNDGVVVVLAREEQRRHLPLLTRAYPTGQIVTHSQRSGGTSRSSAAGSWLSSGVSTLAIAAPSEQESDVALCTIGSSSYETRAKMHPRSTRDAARCSPRSKPRSSHQTRALAAARSLASRPTQRSPDSFINESTRGGWAKRQSAAAIASSR